MELTFAQKYNSLPLLKLNILIWFLKSYKLKRWERARWLSDSFFSTIFTLKIKNFTFSLNFHLWQWVNLNQNIFWSHFVGFHWLMNGKYIKCGELRAHFFLPLLKLNILIWFSRVIYTLNYLHLKALEIWMSDSSFCYFYIQNN